MILKNGAGSTSAATDNGARDFVGIGKCEERTSKPSLPPTQDRVIAQLSGSDTCSAAGITATGHAPILAMCRQLLQVGLNPDQALEVYRAGILALTVRSIAQGARLTVEDDSRGTPRFRPWRGGAASLVRHNRASDTGHLADVPPLLARGVK